MFKQKSKDNNLVIILYIIFYILDYKLRISKHHVVLIITEYFSRIEFIY